MNQEAKKLLFDALKAAQGCLGHSKIYFWPHI
jgi:hypothetical protein